MSPNEPRLLTDWLSDCIRWSGQSTHARCTTSTTRCFRRHRPRRCRRPPTTTHLGPTLRSRRHPRPSSVPRTTGSVHSHDAARVRSSSDTRPSLPRLRYTSDQPQHGVSCLMPGETVQRPSEHALPDHAPLPSASLPPSSLLRTPLHTPYTRRSHTRVAPIHASLPYTRRSPSPLLWPIAAVACPSLRVPSHRHMSITCPSPSRFLTIRRALAATRRAPTTRSAFQWGLAASDGRRRAAMSLRR